MEALKKTPPILIIDDDESIRELLQLVFESRGIYNIKTAVNGQEGFEKLLEYQEPCIVFLDLMMPICSGWQFLEKLSHEPGMAMHQILVMSASRPDRDELKEYEFFQKPLDVSRLFEFIEKACKKIS